MRVTNLLRIRPRSVPKYPSRLVLVIGTRALNVSSPAPFTKRSKHSIPNYLRNGIPLSLCQVPPIQHAFWIEHLYRKGCSPSLPTPISFYPR